MGAFPGRAEHPPSGEAFQVSRKTVRRALADPGPWEYHRQEEARAPVMDPVAGVVER
jgi:hypothetical protein